MELEQMLATETKSTIQDTQTELETFLQMEHVRYDKITQEQVEGLAQSNLLTQSLAEGSALYNIVKSLSTGTNLLTMTHIGIEFARKLFFQLYLQEPFPGKTLFLLPDTKLCQEFLQSCKELMKKPKKLSLQAFQTLARPTREKTFPDIVITSGPIIQDCLLHKEKAAELYAWLATLQIVVVPNVHFLSHAKRSLVVSLLEMLRPKQLFITTAPATIQSLDTVQHFMTTLTTKETLLVRYADQPETVTYFTIHKDFTFTKRLKLFQQLREKGQLVVVLTQNPHESQKLTYEVQQHLKGTSTIAVKDLDLGTDEIGSGPVFNVDTAHTAFRTERIIHVLKQQPAMLVTSNMPSKIETDCGTITFLMMGLPKRIGTFYSMLSAIRSSHTEVKKQVIVLGTTDYERLLVSNTDLFKEYLQSSMYQQDSLQHSTLYKLSIARVRMHRQLPLEPDVERILQEVQLARKDHNPAGWELTGIGKLFMRDYVTFKKKRYTIYFPKASGKRAKNKIIDLELMDELYYPGTLHYEAKQLFRVKKFVQDNKGNKKPVFERLAHTSRIAKRYHKDLYGTFVEPEITYDPDRKSETGLTMLNSTPRYLYTSSIDRSVQPYSLNVERKILEHGTPSIQFGQLVIVDFYEQPMNMAMVVHAFMYALTILHDCDFRDFSYAFTSKKTLKDSSVTELMLIDRVLSDIFFTINIGKTIATARQVLTQHFSSIRLDCLTKPEQCYTAVVLPLPHKRYHPSKDECFSYARITDCFTHLTQALIAVQRQNQKNIQDDNEAIRDRW